MIDFYLNIIALVAITVGGFAAALSSPSPQYNKDGSVSLATEGSKDDRIAMYHKQRLFPWFIALVAVGGLLQIISVSAPVIQESRQQRLLNLELLELQVEEKRLSVALLNQTYTPEIEQEDTNTKISSKGESLESQDLEERNKELTESVELTDSSEDVLSPQTDLTLSLKPEVESTFKFVPLGEYKSD